MKLNYEHLVGRAYIPGRVHCWSLVRDLYKDNFGIEYQNYSIPVNWDSNSLNLIELSWENEGVFKVENWDIRKLQPADILCLAIRSANPNHLAVYLGGGDLIHHPYAQLSRVEPMRDFWRMSTCYVLRHPDVPAFEPEFPTISIKDLARARYHPQTEA